METPRVPLNDPKRQNLALQKEITHSVERILERGRYILGPEHDEFEREFAAFCGTKACVAVANGTDALELALRAIDAGAGDEVIVAANAGMYSTIACNLVNAIPVYVDVDDSLTLSPGMIAEAVGPRTKAVIVTHLYGKLGDVDGIRDAVSRHKPERVWLIEDCSQAHGAVRRGSRAGAFGDIGTFSFYPTKNLAALGDGGALVTNDDALAGRLRLLRQYGWESRYNSVVARGRNSRMDELQAAILRIKLPRLDEWNHVRREVIRRYMDASRGSLLRFPHAPEQDFVAHLCVVRHPDRAQARRHFEQKGIATDIHYPINDYDQVTMRSISWRGTSMTVTERSSKEIFTLPCFAEMTEAEIERVCAALRDLP